MSRRGSCKGRRSPSAATAFLVWLLRRDDPAVARTAVCTTTNESEDRTHYSPGPRRPYTCICITSRAPVARCRESLARARLRESYPLSALAMSHVAV